MNCWHCDRPASGNCRFCGRALCKQDAQSLPHIEVLYRNLEGVQKALVVADALYCGVCKPGEEPVEIPQLE